MLHTKGVCGQRCSINVGDHAAPWAKPFMTVALLHGMQVLRNSKAMADRLMELGYTLVSGGRPRLYYCRYLSWRQSQRRGQLYIARRLGDSLLRLITSMLVSVAAVDGREDKFTRIFESSMLLPLKDDPEFGQQ